eukprot:g3911.t1
MLPVIGYMGARLRNRTLIGCFAGCNVCGICFFLITLLVLFSGLSHLREWEESCETRAVAEGASNFSCTMIRTKYMKLLAANIVFGGTAFIFNVLGCVWGWQLFEHQYYNEDSAGAFGSGKSGWYDV